MNISVRRHTWRQPNRDWGTGWSWRSCWWTKQRAEELVLKQSLSSPWQQWQQCWLQAWHPCTPWPAICVCRAVDELHTSYLICNIRETSLKVVGFAIRSILALAALLRHRDGSQRPSALSLDSPPSAPYWGHPTCPPGNSLQVCSFLWGSWSWAPSSRWRCWHHSTSTKRTA